MPEKELNDKRRVVVIGAGASHSYKDSPTGQRPPLAKDIFSTFNKLDISANRLVLIGQILNYVRDTRGVDPIEFLTWNEDLELFFTELDETITSLAHQLPFDKDDKGSFLKFLNSKGAYSQLLFLFAAILNEIQNGPISIPYAVLANELSRADTLITFNWDTLMDRALISTQKWFPNNGYFIKPEAIFNDGWKSPDSFDYPSDSPLYLKLHGSTNWLSPYEIFNLKKAERQVLSNYALNKLYVFLQATHPYETFENRYWGPYEPFSYCYYPPNLPGHRDGVPKGYVETRMLIAPDLPDHGKIVTGDKAVYSMPLIVPPIRNKQYARYGNIFSPLWEKASETISRCHQLYIIGYSFPDTDIVAKDMFKTALSHNQTLEKIIIINPSPQRIEEILSKEFAIEHSKISVRAMRFDVALGGSPKILHE